MTRAPESAEVMKKIAMRIRAPIVSTIVPGRCWNSWKSAPCRSTLPAASVIEPGVSISSLSAEPPSTANHRMPRRVGTISGRGELGLIVVAAELDVAVAAEAEKEAEGDEERGDQHVVPAEPVDDRRLDRAEERLGLRREDDREEAEQQRHGGGGADHPEARSGAPGGGARRGGGGGIRLGHTSRGCLSGGCLVGGGRGGVGVFAAVGVHPGMSPAELEALRGLDPGTVRGEPAAALSAAARRRRAS